MRKVSIIIPTQRRPHYLRNAAGSVLRQTLPPDLKAELVIVDNDPDASARAAADRLAHDAPFPVIYAHEPKPGVATARNAGMAAASGELIAFLDDDEEAPPDWLANLVATCDNLEADAVFGPIATRLPPHLSPYGPYFEAFFDRRGPASDSLIDIPFGCGNSLVVRKSLHDPLAPFPVARDHNGGEDDYVFSRMKSNGARFAFSARALVLEHPLPSRLTLSYTLLRAFAFGQGGTTHKRRQVGPHGVALSMAIGACQFLVFGAAAAALKPFRPTAFARTAELAARGLGKVLWLEQFYPRLYGRIEPAVRD
jgi:glycosyltransferase involved in cell wall biosynthesis